MSFDLYYKLSKKPGDRNMDKVIENWDKILQTVKADYDVGDVAFNTWLKPLKVYDVRDHVITILVPSEQVVLIKSINFFFRLRSVK